MRDKEGLLLGLSAERAQPWPALEGGWEIKNETICD